MCAALCGFQALSRPPQNTLHDQHFHAYFTFFELQFIETEAQRAEATSLGRDSWKSAELRLEPTAVCARPLTPQSLRGCVTGYPVTYLHHLSDK